MLNAEYAETLKIGKIKILLYEKFSYSEKSLSVTFDCKLKFINHKIFTYNELLSKDGTGFIQHQNTQKLGMRMFKVVKSGNHKTAKKTFCVAFMNFDKEHFFISSQ